jgi:hypothetical protein
MRLLAFAFAPRSTMARTEHSHRATAVLVAAAALSSASRDIDPRALDQIASPSILALVVVVCLIVIAVAIGIFYLFAWIATVTGHWLEGTGSVPRVRTALAWGFAPLILALVYRIPALIFWPDASAVLGGAAKRRLDIGEVELSLPAADAPPYQVAILALLQLVFLAWYLIVASQTLAEAQGFSPWRGFANLMLAFVLPVVAVIVIAAAAFLAR